MIDEAIQWLKRHTIPDQGIIIHTRKPVCYPEVTGYFIPTLLQIGERDLARQYARWLVTVQQADGSFHGAGDPCGYAFDTGQVVRGWAAALPGMPELEQPVRRACDWLLSTADARTGRLVVPAPGRSWKLGDRGEINEGIHLYALAPIRACGHLLNENRYLEFVDRSREEYLAQGDLTDFERSNALSHFFAYIQEALVELGCVEEARAGMASVARYQQDNGAVPAYSNVPWVCSTGLAQLAKVWFTIGEPDRADRALEFLAKLQNPSGGFFGSYGVSANYFPAAEISWAVKYAIEAVQLQIAHHFDSTSPVYREEIPEQDGRVQAVVRHFGDLNGKRVLDAGCGKGRYSRILHRLYPRAEITGLDLSAKMLAHLPPGVRPVLGSLLDLPVPDASQDAVLCAEALEHAVNIGTAVRELCRVLAPGGRLAIVDKNSEKTGTLKTPSWEKWFGQDELLDLLRGEGLDVSVEAVAYEKKTQADGLFLCWTATRSTRPAVVPKPSPPLRQSARLNAPVPESPDPVWQLALSLGALHAGRVGWIGEEPPDWVRREAASHGMQLVLQVRPGEECQAAILSPRSQGSIRDSLDTAFSLVQSDGPVFVLASTPLLSEDLRHPSATSILPIVMPGADGRTGLFSLHRCKEAM